MLARVGVDGLVPWLVRAIWVVALLVGGPAIDGATDGRADAVASVARWTAFGGWAIGMIAVAVPAVVSLTLARLIVPVSVPVAALAWLAGADARDGALALATAIVATTLVGSAELGRSFAQAAAYGDEERFPLRPPASYLLAAVIAWVVTAATAIAGPLLLADREWVLGAAITAIAVASAVWAWPRWHRLSRRWLVLVPAGVVVHDHVALAETLMLRRQDLARLRLAPAGTEALDLTGPAGGHAFEITTTAPVTAIVGANGRVAAGTAVHLSSCLVAPSRPGRALGAAARRRLPVG